MNVHSRIAKRRMCSMRVAKLAPELMGTLSAAS